MMSKKIKKNLLKNKWHYWALILPVYMAGGNASAQTGKIKTGEVYELKSRLNGEVLDIRNASLDNNADVNTWTETKSDAEQWKVTSIGRNLFTLRNIASGKLLHISSIKADSTNVDQQDSTASNDVQWVIEKAGKDLFYLKPAAKPGFSLTVSNGNGAKINLALYAKSDNEKWYFLQTGFVDSAPAISIAEKSFDAWYTKFHIDTSAGFWDKAEMMEIVLDALEVTKDVRYEEKFNGMYSEFIKHNKEDWMYNKYNDDITWAVLACVRGFLLTGNRIYLDKGKEQFDKMYARAFTNLYGGGLNWYETKQSKNACINGPAIVACCYLAQATGDNTYYDKAIALYTWSKVYLLNVATGKVNDNVDLDKRSKRLRVSDWSSTYNQGTYLGAAVMLYKYTKEDSYLNEAKNIARYTRDSMYKGGVMNNEGDGNDLPGFKGIFARYARMYAAEGNQSDLNDWLQMNRKTAFNNRNSQGIIQTKWATRTSENQPGSAFGASTAVSLFFNSLFLHQ